MAKYIYISGPVTGLVFEGAKAAFDQAAEEIRRKHGNAVVVVNPMEFIQRGEDWNYAMRKCIERMMVCNYIHMLPGFEKSKGARLELTIAQGLNFGVCNEKYELENYECSGI